MDSKFWNDKKHGFVKVVLKTSNGEYPIKFSDYESFYKVFTPQRMEILTLLSNQKARSINELSKILNRDKKNVRNDVGILEASGLIQIEKRLNRKVPELTAESMIVSIDFKNVRPRSRKRKARKY